MPAARTCTGRTARGDLCRNKTSSRFGWCGRCGGPSAATSAAARTGPAADPDPLEVPLPPQEVLIDPPMVGVDTVWHIGTMDPDRRSGWSLEGHALSVSVHPDEWERIARLGGRERWRLDGPFAMIDALSLTDTDREAVARWAQHEQLLTPATVWHAHLGHDDELDDEIVMVFDTETEARSEAEGCEVDDVDAAVVPVAGWKATDALTGVVGRSDPADAFEHALLVWAESAGYDGVWFEERLDVAALSAPRGGLFAVALSRAAATAE